MWRLFRASGFLVAIMAATVTIAAPNADGPKAGAAIQLVAAAASSGDEAPLREEQRARDKAEIEATLVGANSAWFATLVATIGALFGVLITVTVIFLTFRFGRDAVNEAKSIVEKEIGEQKAKIDTTLAEALRATERAHQLLSQAETQADTVAARLRELSPISPPKEEREPIAKAAATAQAKPRNERTVDDFRALVLQASEQKDWNAVRQRAETMAYLFEKDNPADACWALFARAYAEGQLGDHALELKTLEELDALYSKYDDPTVRETVALALGNKGVALGQLGRQEDAIAVYDELERRYGTSNQPVLREQIAKALFDKGVALDQIGKPENAVAAYAEIARRFGTSDEEAIREQVADALFNKAVALGRMGRTDEAIAAYEEIDRRYGASDRQALRERVANALFNLACTAGRQGETEDAISKLRRWAARRGSFGCEAMKDPDFDPIRDQPVFEAFLQEMGC